MTRSTASSMAYRTVTWARNVRPIAVGDTVAYTKAFLESIYWFAGAMPHARGIVTGFVPAVDASLAEIAWDTPGLPRRAPIKNLCIVEQITLD